MVFILDANFQLSRHREKAMVPYNTKLHFLHKKKKKGFYKKKKLNRKKGSLLKKNFFFNILCNNICPKKKVLKIIQNFLYMK
jgi:hypothetical protein